MSTKGKSYNYSEILNEFGEEKLIARYESLYNYMESYIARNKLSDKVFISENILNQVIIDYFADIHRLKSFHQIQAVNFLKIHAYTAYWLLRRKPLQIKDDDVDNVDLAFVNEKFITSYLLQYLRDDNFNVVIVEERKQDYLDFAKNLEYSLRYRTITPQMIETTLTSFKAGMAFQKSIDSN